MHKRGVALVLTIAVLSMLSPAGRAAPPADPKAAARQVTFTGRVTDAQGVPIVGAKAALYRERYDASTTSAQTDLLAEKTTGTDGTFTFGAASDAESFQAGYILVHQEGLALSWATWPMQSDQSMDIKLGPGKELSGDVVDEKGQPIPGAEVSSVIAIIGTMDDQRYLPRLETVAPLGVKADSRGHFVFENMPAEATFEFLVQKSGRATVRTSAPAGQRNKGQFSAGQSGIKIVLPPAATIRGVVVEKAGGKPVGGMKIRAQAEPPGTPQASEPVMAGADGVFQIRGLCPGDYSVRPILPSQPMPEWVAEPVSVSLKVGETRSDLKVELTKGAIVEVLVKDRDGKPFAQAEVAFRPVAGGLMFLRRADENGLLRVRVPPGEYEFYGTYTRPSGRKSNRREGQFPVAEGETQHIEYVPGFSLKIPGVLENVGIAGIVRDQAGHPLPDVEVQVVPTRMLGQQIYSDASGQFVIPPDPIPMPRNTTLVLIARDEAHNLAASALIEERGRALDLKLQPCLTVTGTVLSEEGQPLAGARVQVSMIGPRFSSIMAGDPMHPLTTGPDGVFEVKSLPMDRQYTIRVAGDSYGSQSVPVNPDDSKDQRYDAGRLKLPAAKLALAGLVVDPNGKPMPKALINASGEGQPDRLHTWTDAEGKFTIQGVCSGPIRVLVSTPAPRPMHATTQAQGGATDLRIVVTPLPAARNATTKRPTPLKGKPLPPLKDLGVELPAEAKGKMLLVCFWDMSQRPARNCLTQLAARASQLTDKGVLVVPVHAVPVEDGALRRWLETNKVPFRGGTLTGDSDKARLAWGATSLPHLILTDKKHIVVAEGFGLNDLDNQIEAAGR